MRTELTWFKSSYSGGQGGECLEAALAWRESTHRCASIHIRDSKNPDGPALALSPAAWTSFLAHTTHHRTGSGGQTSSSTSVIG
ncbi:DUF397 domain-containing protein [Streptomyces sp. SB3404]|uniref:DUF397 domain-containing protein n=1 Tax=Streptomyces boncukensis TaxID=2711219 RepID=A0A6G4WZA4_9ACTN|nr:DUF397 domain-containing protein [Streptomyces boncukensis]